MLTSKYFSTQELVDEETYNLLEDYAIKLLDERLIKTIDSIREILDVPLICNNWHWGGSRDQCGFRSYKSNVGSPKSFHKQGLAVDLISTQMSAKDMRDKLYKYQDILPYPIRIEKWNGNEEISWLHVDLSPNTHNQKIYFFRA